jgi:hypothetical protein
MQFGIVRTVLSTNAPSACPARIEKSSAVKTILRPLSLPKPVTKSTLFPSCAFCSYPERYWTAHIPRALPLSFPTASISLCRSRCQPLGNFRDRAAVRRVPSPTAYLPWESKYLVSKDLMRSSFIARTASDVHNPCCLRLVLLQSCGASQFVQVCLSNQRVGLHLHLSFCAACLCSARYGS